MKELSTEIIEIGGKEYTLFLNRKGVIAFEKTSKILQTVNEMAKKYQHPVEEEMEIDPNANPFEVYGEDNEVDEDTKKLKEVFIKFYWIALYEHQQLNLEEVRELFEQAEKEYGLGQLVDLGYQMIEDVNKDKGSVELKKLKALRPKKK